MSPKRRTLLSLVFARKSLYNQITWPSNELSNFIGIILGIFIKGMLLVTLTGRLH